MSVRSLKAPASTWCRDVFWNTTENSVLAQKASRRTVRTSAFTSRTSAAEEGKALCGSSARTTFCSSTWTDRRRSTVVLCEGNNLTCAAYSEVPRTTSSFSSEFFILTESAALIASSLFSDWWALGRRACLTLCPNHPPVLVHKARTQSPYLMKDLNWLKKT